MTPDADLPPRAIPELELNLFLNTVTEAVGYAAQGLPGEGYQSLHYGLQRARAAAEEPWGPELIACYERALAEYTRQHAGGNGHARRE